MLGQGGQKMAPSVERIVLMERGWRPNTEAAPNCPRCDSTNTKFCYYNNYSLTQPRYFCKTCRRYWTKGGSLRNVPVGGGCRKNRRSKSARTAVDRDPATMMDSRSLSSDSDPSRNLHGGFSEIDLALVYEKYVSQQPDQVLYNFDHSQPICSQPNSGPLLPDLSADIRLDFEIGIDRNAYDFGEVQGGNEVGVQLQTYCDQGAVDLFHEFRGDGSYEPDGFQYDLGLHQVTNPTFPNPNLQHHLMEEVPRVENFSFCPDFVPNCWSSTDLHSYGSLFHIQHIQKDKR